MSGCRVLLDESAGRYPDRPALTQGERTLTYADFDAAVGRLAARLGPLARHCWRAPIRDYRPRMKEVLKLQGLFPLATVREPQLPVDDAERAAIARLVRQAGLVGTPEPLGAVGG